MITKIIEGFDNYSIDVEGNVRNKKRGRVLKGLLDNKGGYVRVNLYKNSKMSHKLIHRLVAQAFIPNPENKREVNHIDNNPKNNSIDNLEWCTSGENVRHSASQGRMKGAGSSHSSYRLTEEQVKNVKYHLQLGISTQNELGILHKVSRHSIRGIKNGKTYRHFNK